MDPRVWGPEVWKFMHSMAWMCDASKADFVPFIFNLQRVLPCSECSDHFKTLLKEHPPVSPFFQWTVAAHNNVNKRVKRGLVIEYEIAEFREHLKKACPFTTQGLLRMLLLIANFSEDIRFTRDLFKSIDTIFQQSKHVTKIPAINLDIEDCLVTIDVFNKYNSLKYFLIVNAMLPDNGGTPIF